MPGFATHYIFGRETYRKLKCNPQKRNIYHNRAAYALGLQGPDLFFFYLPSYALYKSNLGSIAHTQETGAFFLGLIESCCRITDSTDRSIAEAYLTGFLGHYLLDTACHPYVYAATHYSGPKKDYFWRHAYLETDIDTALLDLKLHRKPCQFHAASTMPITMHFRRCASERAPCGQAFFRSVWVCGCSTTIRDKKKCSSALRKNTSLVILCFLH